MFCRCGAGDQGVGPNPRNGSRGIRGSLVAGNLVVHPLPSGRARVPDSNSAVPFILESSANRAIWQPGSTHIPVGIGGISTPSDIKSGWLENRPAQDAPNLRLRNQTPEPRASGPRSEARLYQSEQPAPGNSRSKQLKRRLVALKRPAVTPAEGLLTEAVLKHAHCTEPPPLTPSHPLRLSCRS